MQISGTLPHRQNRASSYIAHLDLSNNRLTGVTVGTSACEASHAVSGRMHCLDAIARPAWKMCEAAADCTLTLHCCHLPVLLGCRHNPSGLVKGARV